MEIAKRYTALASQVTISAQPTPVMETAASRDFRALLAKRDARAVSGPAEVRLTTAQLRHMLATNHHDDDDPLLASLKAYYQLPPLE
jgi:hypothetical protein